MRWGWWPTVRWWGVFFPQLKRSTRWWFQRCFIFSPTSKNDPIWLLCFPGGMKPPTRNYLEYWLNALPKSRLIIFQSYPFSYAMLLLVSGRVIGIVLTTCKMNVFNIVFVFRTYSHPLCGFEIMDLLQLFFCFRGHGSQTLLVGCAQKYRI